MPVPALLTDLSASASANSPQATETVGPIMNEYIQAAYAFIAQLYTGGLVPTAGLNMNSQQINNLANGALSTDAVNLGQLETYLPLTGGTITNAFTFNGTGVFTVLTPNQQSCTIQGGTASLGANIRLFDASTSSAKFIRCLANAFNIINNAYTAIIFTVDDSGNLTAAGNITAFSDERLKKNWTQVSPNFIDQLSKVKSGTYSRTDIDLRQAGVSAQDMAKVLPEVVVSDDKGMLSLAYGQAALVAAIELAKEVKILRKRIEELEHKP